MDKALCHHCVSMICECTHRNIRQNNKITDEDKRRPSVIQLLKYQYTKLSISKNTTIAIHLTAINRPAAPRRFRLCRPSFWGGCLCADYLCRMVRPKAAQSSGRRCSTAPAPAALSPAYYRCATAQSGNRER